VRLDRFLSVAGFILIIVLWQPPAVSADHCGAAATISPASGPPGTTLVFRTNLGSRSDLRIYKGDRLVREVALDGSGDVRYRIGTAPGDAGVWRARAEVRGRPDCGAEVSFAVVGPPDTSVRPDDRATRSEMPGTVLTIGAALVAFFFVITGATIRRS
jgi:hypothetical protein